MAGTPGPRYRIQVTNVGGGVLELPAPALSGSFSIDAPIPALRAGESVDVRVSMKTDVAGDTAGELTLTTPIAAKSSYRFALRGTVVAAPAGTLRNPHFTTADWKLWAENATPVSFTSGATTQSFSTPLEASRVFPDDTLVPAWPGIFLRVKTYAAAPRVAGFWDDAYATQDSAHTVLSWSWSGSMGNSVDLTNQFIRIDYGQASTLDRKRLGVNFTSESHAYKGHQLISGGPFGSIASTEREWTFVNTVRATPSYRSFEETDPEQAADNYDALYAHSFESLGRSGSELRALQKMLIAGGHLPRATKDLLKRHGAYANTLLGVFRQALPYANADGADVPYESELRHRPTYLSNGLGTTTEFAPHNIAYHQYDDTAHLHRMVEIARALDVAPPVAVFTLDGIQVEKGGAVTVPWTKVDRRIKSSDKTNLRVWPDPEETITVAVDLGLSIDLQGLPLSFRAHAVYPEQKNVSIRHYGDTGRFEITVRHDAMLPLGRIPVLFYADNGRAKSNVVFVNLFWPQVGQVTMPYNQYAHPTKTTADYTSDPRAAVFRNKRPILTTTAPSGAITVMRGATATFNVECSDPEGYPTRLSRWAGERGVLQGNVYTLATQASDAAGTIRAHFVCSDGTGGFAGIEVPITLQ